ncbi:MAG: NAD(P)/FAD-dependent oxidoreductase [Haliscomenobacter sp.]|nr:NAD(P)/FAD-dependent oxidoreductase [Haliscomenobacter sp.]
MSTVLIIGAGIAGHTAATFLKKELGKKHRVVVVSPSAYYQWIPSNIWVGVGRMKEDQVRFRLEGVYRRMGIEFHQARAVSIFPEGGNGHEKPFVHAVYTDPKRQGQEAELEYDFLVNATGPKLNFEATEGLGPATGNSYSVCSSGHAKETWEALERIFEAAKKGERQRILIGTGHPTATCQGAAFEYALNVAFEAQRRRIKDKLDITWITNEYELGDFGMAGAFVRRSGYVIHTKEFTESILAEYGVKWIKRAGVYKVEPGVAHYELLDGSKGSISFDFAMLLPAFAGVGLRAFDRQGADITPKLFAPSGFMKVDADYSPKAFEDFQIEDWPSTYQNPDYSNIFAIGIAFAPPHPISKPMFSPNGTAIFPSPPRTGMPAGVTGKITADNITEMIKQQRTDLRHKASMGKMGAACIVSAGYGFWNGQAATMTVNPIVPDWNKYPEFGRNVKYTIGEIGLAGHWVKLFLHYMFIHKAKGYPFWWLLPE